MPYDVNNSIIFYNVCYMEMKMFTSIEKKYYVKFQKNNEALRETINRIDSKLIDDNFKWVCDRDIVTSDVIFNYKESNNKVREWKRGQEFAD